MATLTVRNLKDTAAKRLKDRAKKNKRSMEAEARAILEDAVKPGSSVDFWELAERIAAMTPPGRRQTDSTKIIRKDRDSR